ncbi:hypothetical protein [Mameliella sediminis]|uniref:hypothetical protein n=1 Tax=Mameliella sediminis TaxID=2836866 RepID=UPI001C48B6AB|nr:hypothetical protein [Mameliella sediminis]MBV7395211.1 hypothetical protein [Mameliella sediminis]MBY6159593.1 hypothetical protein [Mameliella alba]MBY6168064.1 hypothetical protein [Mameliella alba]MBY6173085.1 hypothetical protein [Mameliella alba]
MKFLRLLAASAALAALPFAVLADDDDDDGPQFGMAGILSAKNKEDLPPIILSAGVPISEAPWELKSGTYYEFEIEADGSQELALVGPEFFRAIWIDEIVIEGLEIRPLGLDSVEFDEAGTMEIGFLAIKPGSYYMKIPGSTGETQRIEITIK